MDYPPAKRSRTVQWRATFDQCASLVKLLGIMDKVLSTISMRLVKTPDGGRLHIDSMNDHKTCLVQARMDVMKFETFEGGDYVTFCTNAKPLIACINSTPAHFSLEIVQYSGSSSLFMRSFDNLSNSHVFEAEVKTIADESETADMVDLTYKFEVQIDLGILRNIVKVAHYLSAQDIRLQVFEPRDDSGSDQRLTAFRVSAEGGVEATPANTFMSQLGCDSNVIRTEDNIQSDVNVEDMRETFSASFDAEYMHDFMKAMERQTLSMKMSPNDDGSPAQPLIMEYPLGKNGDYIKFILAAKVPDEEDPKP